MKVRDYEQTRNRAAVYEERNRRSCLSMVAAALLALQRTDLARLIEQWRLSRDANDSMFAHWLCVL